MNRLEDFRRKVLNLQSDPEGFDRLAMEIFLFQAIENPVYRKFLELVGCEPFEIESLEAIPFLPVSLFKTRLVQTGDWRPETHFLSSGTTGQERSKHLIHSLEWYNVITRLIFAKQVIPLENVAILGLLPTYLENPNSSLIQMVRSFGAESGYPVSFCGLDFDQFRSDLERARGSGRQVVIFSVTYALLRLSWESGWDLSDCIVVETGGMKGLETNLPKQALLDQIGNSLKVKHLYSEYGMTEMQSQAYSSGLVYKPGFSLKVLVREVEDPLGGSKRTGRGALNIVDLANFSTCSFLATDDLGQIQPDGKFEVFGRIDGSEIRGCNLLFA